MKILDNNKNFSLVSKSNHKQNFFARQYGNTCIQKTKFTYSSNGFVMWLSDNQNNFKKLIISSPMIEQELTK